MSMKWESQSNRQAGNRSAIDSYRADNRAMHAQSRNTPAMQNMLRDFMDRNRPNGSFLTEDMRADLADSGIVFSIVAVRDATTKFGPTWFVDIVLDHTGEPQRFTMPMAHNDVRDRQLLEFKTALESGTFNSLPVILTSYEAQLGTGYSFDTPPDEWWNQTAIPGTGYDASGDDLPDDVVPF